jgi:hypothetical protein
MSLPEPPPHEIFIPRFLTYVPGRGRYSKYAGFKQHKSIGHAKLAINQALYNYGRNGSTHTMAIWEFNFEDHKWELLYSIKPGTLISTLPWKKEN